MNKELIRILLAVVVFWAAFFLAVAYIFYSGIPLYMSIPASIVFIVAVIKLIKELTSDNK